MPATTSTIPLIKDIPPVSVTVPPTEITEADTLPLDSADEPRQLPEPLTTEEAFRIVLEQARSLTRAEPSELTLYLNALRTRLAESGLKQTNPALATAYDQVVRYLQFSSLASLSDAEVVALFRFHLLESLRTDVDLKTQLEMLFLFRSDDLLLRTVRRQVLNAMSANEEPIGQGTIIIPELPGRQPSEVRFWILDFIRYTTVVQRMTSLELATYLTESPNVRGLTPDEKNLLRQVFTLYLYIVTAPIAPYALGYLQTAGVAPAGQAPVTAPLDTRAVILQQLFEQDEMEQAIYAAEKRVLGRSGYSFDQVLAEFKAGIAQKNIPTATGAAFLLARSGDIRELLSRDAEFAQLMEETILPALVNTLQDKHRRLSHKAIIEDFRRQPNRPVYLKCFLEHVLTEVCGGRSEESARFGIRVESFLYREGHQEMVGMAFYDEAARRYRWAEVGLDSQGVPTLLG